MQRPWGRSIPGRSEADQKGQMSGRVSKGAVAGKAVLGQIMQVGSQGPWEDFGFDFEADRSHWEKMGSRSLEMVGCSRALHGCAHQT